MKIKTKETYNYLGYDLEIKLPSYSLARASKQHFLAFYDALKTDEEQETDITDELIENVAQAIVSYIPKLSIEDAKNLLVIGSDIDTLEFLGYLFAFGKVSDADKKK